MTPTAEEPRKVTQLLSNPYTKFPEDAYTQGQQEHSLLRYKCPPRDGMLLTNDLRTMRHNHSKLPGVWLFYGYGQKNSDWSITSHRGVPAPSTF